MEIMANKDKVYKSREILLQDSPPSPKSLKYSVALTWYAAALGRIQDTGVRPHLKALLCMWSPQRPAHLSFCGVCAWRNAVLDK